METKEFMKLIVKIRKDKITKKLKTFIKKYVHNNLVKLNKDVDKLVFILREISNKKNTEIKETIKLFFNYHFENIETKDCEKIIDSLNVFFDDETWKYISVNICTKLSLEFIEKHLDKINWKCISKNKNLTEQFIEKYTDKIDWFYISIYQKLTEQFIEKYAHKINWFAVSIYQKLSENFIEKHAHKVNWFYISKYQKLSEQFIEKHAHKVNWKYIFKYQNISEEFKKKHAWRIK